MVGVTLSVLLSAGVKSGVLSGKGLAGQSNATVAAAVQRLKAHLCALPYFYKQYSQAMGHVAVHYVCSHDRI